MSRVRDVGAKRIQACGTLYIDGLRKFAWSFQNNQPYFFSRMGLLTSLPGRLF